MKIPYLPILLACALAAASTASAQLTMSATATGSPAAKPKILGPTEKKFVKDTTDSMYFVTELIGQGKKKAKTPQVKALSGKVKKDYDKIWADVAGFASAHGETMNNTLKGADKMAADRLQEQQGEDWDKEFLKLTSKE